MSEKVCTKCHEALPRDNFYKRKEAPDGLMTQCKKCWKSHVKTYAEKNREKVLQDKRNYYNNNREVLREKGNAYASEHREEKQAYDEKYYEENYDRIRALQNDYAAEHREEKQTYDEAYRLENLDLLRKKGRDRYYADLDASRAKARLLGPRYKKKKAAYDLEWKCC